jgi:signal transduction histidine kinase
MNFFNRIGFVPNLRIIALLVVWCLCTVVSGVQFVRFFFVPDTGLMSEFPEFRPFQGRIVYSPRDPFERRIKGIVVPDVDAITAFDGKAIRSMKDLVDGLYSMQIYSRVTLTLVNTAGTERNVTIEPVPNILRFDWIFTLVFLIVSSTVGLLLILKFHQSIEYNIASIAALLYMLHTASNPLYFESLGSFAILQIGYLAPWFVGALALYFPAKKGTATIRLFIAVFVATLSGVFMVSKIILFALWQKTGSDAFYSLLLLTERITRISDLLPLFAFLVLCGHSYLTARSAQYKRQLEWTIFGFLIALTPYFFFEKLPFVFGDSIGERLGLGNFSNLFLCIFPAFFLVGVSTNKTMDLRKFVSRTTITVICLILLVFGYLVVFNPTVAFLHSAYGLAEMHAYALLSLLFISLGLSLLFIGDLLLARLLSVKDATRRKADEIGYRRLKIEHERLLASKKSDYQKEKMKEIGYLFRGISDRFRISDRILMKSIDRIESRFRKLFNLVGSHPNADENEMRRLAFETEKELVSEKESIIVTREIFTKFEAALFPKPGIKTWVRTSYILKLAVADVEKRYENADIDVESTTKEKIYCVQHEIAAAVREIIFNAIESQANSFGRVRVTLSSVPQKVVIEIADSGTGISELSLAKIDSPFHSTKDGHIGLGLYVCKTFVQHNDGTISFTNSKGRGTVVTLAFPTGYDSEK